MVQVTEEDDSKIPKALVKKSWKKSGLVSSAGAQEPPSKLTRLDSSPSPTPPPIQLKYVRCKTCRQQRTLLD